MRKLGEDGVPGTIAAATFAAIFTMLLHLVATMVSAIPAVLAPVAAAAFGVHPGRVGVFIAVMFIVSLPAGLLTTRIVTRLGPSRACQIVAAAAAIAVFGMAAAGYGAQWAAQSGVLPPQVFLVVLLAAATVLGLPLGMINPLSSQILFRASPVRLRSFFFSVKQTAVPGGYAVAGLIIPALLLILQWQAALLVVGVGVTLWTVLTLGIHVEVAPPAPQTAKKAGGLRGFFEPVGTVWKFPPLREMALVSLLYSMNQTVMSAYLVSYLNLEVGLSLVAAGALFAAGQFAGMVGRVVWGLSADLWVKPRTQIGLLGIVGGLCGITVSLFSTAWPNAVMLVVCVLFGFSAVSWNGIFLAEVARLSAHRDIGAMTAGTGVFNNMGALFGPGLASLLIMLSGAYAYGFVVFAIPTLILGSRLVLTRRQE